MFQIEIVVIPRGKMTVPYTIEYASIMETLHFRVVSHGENSVPHGNSIVIPHGNMAMSFPMET